MEVSNQIPHGNGQQKGIVDRVKDQAAVHLSTQKERATESLGSVATAIRQSSQPLRDNNQELLAGYANKAADRLEQFSQQLRERDLNGLLNEAKQFARRQPAIFVGAAFVVGALAMRFLKSSPGSARPLDSTETWAYPPATRYQGGA